MDIDTVRAAVSGLTVAMVIGLVGYVQSKLHRAAPFAGDEQCGTIRPSRLVVGSSLLIGIGMFAGGISLFLFDPRHPTIGLILAAVGLTMIVGFFSSLRPTAAVNWSEVGIEGPFYKWGLSFGRQRVRIAWSEAMLIQREWLGSGWYVEAKDGRRVRWDSLYKGYGTLTAALRRYCPGTPRPFDMK